MPIQVNSVTELRSSLPVLNNKQTTFGITKLLPLNATALTSHKTGLTPTLTLSFTGEEQTQTDEYPQGICEQDGMIITSHYFKYAPLQLACKFMVTDPAAQLAARVAPLENVSGTMTRLDIGGGGLVAIGDYLYCVDSPGKRILVLDAREVYSKNDNLHVLDDTDPFFGEFEYFMPVIGVIQCTTPDDVNMAYLSASNSEFVVGNFYFPNSSYSGGGKSMVWRVEYQSGTYEFPAPTPGGFVSEYEPLFPVGANQGTSITKIQGAAITEDNVLILSRSYGSGVKQLVVMDLSNPAGYYLGNTTDPAGHDWKNWKYGCENLCFSEDGTKIGTVTEFHNDRDITFWNVDDITGLMGEYENPSIAEHQQMLAQLQIQLTDLQNEVDYYSLQITSAIAEGLTSFDRETYDPT